MRLELVTHRATLAVPQFLRRCQPPGFCTLGADLLDAYPRLTRDDLQAAMRYAADTVAHEEVVLIGATSSTPQD